MKKIYLDNNASTFVDPLVADVIAHTLRSFPGNPSSPHSFGREARYILLQSRELIAAFLKVRPKEIIFTSGGTEGANMVIRGLLRGNGHLITSDVEHACVYSLSRQLQKEGCEVTFLSPGLHGAVTTQEVKAAIRPDTQLISLMAVNNETGVKTDIKAIAEIAENVKIPFFVDGVALLGKDPFEIPSGVSAMCFSGHKFHAPKGCGFVYIKANLKLQPFILGGEQEYNRRGGTENLADIAGMAEAIRQLEMTLPQASTRMRELRIYFEEVLKKKLPGKIFINGDGERVSNTVNIAFSGTEGESLLMSLDRAGIAASHGSACASGAMELSRILLNMGIPMQRARESIRFSLSRFTTKEEIDQTISTILQLICER
jgi:cysteine desulfurase